MTEYNVGDRIRSVVGTFNDKWEATVVAKPDDYDWDLDTTSYGARVWADWWEDSPTWVHESQIELVMEGAVR